MSAASRGPWAGGFLPKRFAQKPREKLGVWFQLQLLAARSRPETEPNSHYVMLGGLSAVRSAVASQRQGQAPPSAWGQLCSPSPWGDTGRCGDDFFRSARSTGPASNRTAGDDSSSLGVAVSPGTATTEQVVAMTSARMVEASSPPAVATSVLSPLEAK
jgi:hypothetical protein